PSERTRDRDLLPAQLPDQITPQTATAQITPLERPRSQPICPIHRLHIRWVSDVHHSLQLPSNQAPDATDPTRLLARGTMPQTGGRLTTGPAIKCLGCVQHPQVAIFEFPPLPQPQHLARRTFKRVILTQSEVLRRESSARF